MQSVCRCTKRTSFARRTIHSASLPPSEGSVRRTHVRMRFCGLRADGEMYGKTLGTYLLNQKISSLIFTAMRSALVLMDEVVEKLWVIVVL
jgi:hypothetical protein